MEKLLPSKQFPTFPTQEGHAKPKKKKKKIPLTPRSQGYRVFQGRSLLPELVLVS